MPVMHRELHRQDVGLSAGSMRMPPRRARGSVPRTGSGNRRQGPDTTRQSRRLAARVDAAQTAGMPSRSATSFPRAFAGRLSTQKRKTFRVAEVTCRSRVGETSRNHGEGTRPRTSGLIRRSSAASASTLRRPRSSLLVLLAADVHEFDPVEIDEADAAEARAHEVRQSVAPPPVPTTVTVERCIFSTSMRRAMRRGP